MQLKKNGTVRSYCHQVIIFSCFYVLHDMATTSIAAALRAWNPSSLWNSRMITWITERHWSLHRHCVARAKVTNAKYVPTTPLDQTPLTNGLGCEADSGGDGVSLRWTNHSVEPSHHWFIPHLKTSSQAPCQTLQPGSRLMLQRACPTACALNNKGWERASSQVDARRLRGGRSSCHCRC